VHGKGVEPLRLAAAEPKGASSKTLEYFQDVTSEEEDKSDPSKTFPTRFPDTSEDPIEGALADGVRALAEAMRRAPAEALAALAERMAVVVAELEARRKARAKTTAPLIEFSDRTGR
jgi:hypothetical protein